MRTFEIYSNSLTVTSKRIDSCHSRDAINEDMVQFVWSSIAGFMRGFRLVQSNLLLLQGVFFFVTCSHLLRKGAPCILRLIRLIYKCASAS